jgi:hypothetical protein
MKLNKHLVNPARRGGSGDTAKFRDLVRILTEMSIQIVQATRYEPDRSIHLMCTTMECPETMIQVARKRQQVVVRQVPKTSVKDNLQRYHWNLS